MRRFDIKTGPGPSDRDWFQEDCEDGPFCDAEDAARMLKALIEIRDECEPSEWGDVLRICRRAIADNKP